MRARSWRSAITTTAAECNKIQRCTSPQSARQMDFSPDPDFIVPHPVLPDGVAECEGFGRASWITKAVILTNESGVDVARGICHCVKAELVVDNNSMPLGNDRVVVQIAELLLEEDVPSEWMFSIRAWHIRNVFLNGASLYDHDQRYIYKAVVQALNRRPRRGVRQYNSERERQEGALPPKKVLKLSRECINYVLTINCCKKNCVQPYPRAKIHALRSQFFHEGGQYFKSHRLLDVHRQIHLDAHGNEMITLEGVDVCPVAWYNIMGVSRATFYRWKMNASNGMHAEHHGNAGTVKPRSSTVQATVTLRLMLEQTADHMPHHTTTVETGEKVVSKCLPSFWRWKDSLPEIIIVNAQFGLSKVSPSGLSRIRNESFPKYSPKSRGDSFARRGQCDKFKKLRAACTRGSRHADIWTRRAHIDAQTSHRELYYANRQLSEKEPTKVLTIIHDKMDHSKTASLHFSHKKKAIDSLMKLPVAITRMIAHGHGDVRYAHYGLDIYPSDSNHTVGSIAKLLRDLESPPVYSSRQLFVGGGSSPLFQALLIGADACKTSLPPATPEPIMAAPLPPVLNVQLDNACSDNKNRYVFSFFSLLV